MSEKMIIQHLKIQKKNTQLCITIPKSLVDARGYKAGQDVQLAIDENKRLVLVLPEEPKIAANVNKTVNIF